jgi:predicted nucleic acid-binding protein
MYLLDTNVLSELRKVPRGKADLNVRSWAQGVLEAQLFVSVITVFELEIGLLSIARRDHLQGEMLRVWLEDHLLPAFSGRILPITLDISRRAAMLSVPNLRPRRDGMIAATALVHRLMVVTRNVADFAPTGVPILNPWQPIQQR